MTDTAATPGMVVAALSVWEADWLLSLPLIVLTVLLHVGGLTLLHKRLAHVRQRWTSRSYGKVALALGVNVLVLITLHAFQAAIWAAVYLAIGALPDVRQSMLYSLSALTSYGHAEVFLAPRWQMMGAIESLNGMLLLGLSTAFLFFVLHTLWGMDESRER